MNKEIILKINKLDDKEFNNFIYNYLCYRFALSGSIVSISLILNICGKITVLNRNKYYHYGIKQISEDLNNLNLQHRESSNIDINVSTKTYLKDKLLIKSFDVILQLAIISVDDNTNLLKPIPYDIEVYKSLYIINDNNYKNDSNLLALKNYISKSENFKSLQLYNYTLIKIRNF